MPLDDCGGDSGKLWKEMKDGSCCCSERHQLIFIRAIVEFLAPTIARYLMMLNTCVTQRELIESPPQSSHTLEDINEWCCCLRFKQTLIKLTMCYYRPNIRSELLLHLMQLSPAVLVPIIRIIGERLWGQTKVRLGNSEMKDGSCCCSATNDQLVSSLPQNFSHQNLCPHNEPSFPINAQIFSRIIFANAIVCHRSRIAENVNILLPEFSSPSVCPHFLHAL